MIRLTLNIVSAALALSLTGYGVMQGAARGTGSEGSKPASTPILEPPPRKQTEREIILSLKPTPKQLAEYEKLAQWMKDEVVKMKQLGPGAMARGMEINAEWRAGLQKIFSRNQYRTYVRECGHLTISDGTHFNTNYGKAREEQILSTLGLTKAQKKAINELYAEVQKETRVLNELWDGTDADAIANQGSKINTMFKASMERILTPEQYASYRRQWDGPVRRNATPDTRVFSPARPVPRGSIKNDPPLT